MDEIVKQLGGLAILGAVASVGKELASPHGKRGAQLYGNMIISSIFCMSAAALPLAFPAAPFVAMFGVGAILATVGIAFATKLLDKFIEKKFD